MHSLRTFSKFSIFFGIVLILAAGSGYLFFGRAGAKVMASLCGLFFLWNAFQWKSLWVRELRARRVQVIRGLEIYHLDDPSSHFFLFKGPLGHGRAIFMTRGILSLLQPGELDSLVQDCEKLLTSSSSGWNTFISSLQLRLTKFLPTTAQPFFYGAPERPGVAGLWEVFSALPILGLIDFLRRFLVGAPPRAKAIEPQIHDKLLAESYVCFPRFNAAVVIHALINPWPRALFRVGEPCLPEKTWLPLS